MLGTQKAIDHTVRLGHISPLDINGLGLISSLIKKEVFATTTKTKNSPLICLLHKIRLKVIIFSLSLEM